MTKTMLALALCLCAMPVHAAPEQVQDPLDIGFSYFGFRSESFISKGKCEVRMILDQHAFLDKFADLQKLGFINDSLPPGTVVTKPNMLSMAFLSNAITIATKALYEKKPAADKCAFTQIITVPDDYGNEKAVRVLSYSFTRAIYNKVNWDNIVPFSLFKIALQFEFNPEFSATLTTENDR